MSDFIWGSDPEWVKFLPPFWVQALLIIIILPGIKTGFGGTFVWWEPWFYYLIRDYFRKRSKRDESN